MQTHPAKRIEITIEAPLLPRLAERIVAAGGSGYSVMPVIAGHGHDGDWSLAGHIGESGRMVSVVCVVDAGRATALVEAIFPMVARHIGLLTMSDVSVVRPERF